MIQFKYILSNAINGILEIDEPIGWEDTEFKIERQSSHGLPFEASTPVKFYGTDGDVDGGKTYILDVERTQGIDADIFIEIQINSGTGYETFFEGRLNLESLTESFDGAWIECNIEKVSFYATFQKRYNQKVNFENNKNPDGFTVPTFTTNDYTLHGKTIESRWSQETNTRFRQAPNFPRVSTYQTNQDQIFYLIPVFETTTIEDIDGNFTYPTEFSQLNPVTNKKYILQAEEDGSYNIDLNATIEFRFGFIGANIPNESNWVVVKVLYEIFTEDGTSPASSQEVLFEEGYDTNDQGTLSFNFSKNETINLDKGAEIYLYIEVKIDWKGGGDDATTYDYFMLAGSYMDWVTNTKKEDTIAEALYTHDVAANIVNHMTGKSNAFYSETFGNPDVNYPTNYNNYGRYSNHILLTGKQIRKITDHLKLSFKTWYDSHNAMFNIGYDIETVNGQERIRCEHTKYFYQDENILLSSPIENASGLIRSVDPERYYNEIEIGYDKWQPEEINGLDEICTIAEYSLPLKTVGNKYTQKSKILASGSIIESMRRLIEKITTDSEFDDDVFIVSTLQGYRISEKDQNFTNIGGVLDPDTGYNYRLTPPRMLLRHGNVINGCLILYRNSFYRKIYFEGNNDLIATQIDSMNGNYNNQPLDESEPIKWNYADIEEVNPIWRPEYYEFDYPISYQDYKTIKDNKYRRILFTIGGDVLAGYIQTLTYKPVESLASFKLIRANLVPFDFQLADEENLLTESFDDLLTQSGSTIIIQ